jgi:hypothetical protein
MEMKAAGLAPNYRKLGIIWPSRLSIFVNKKFKDMIRDDIISFLNSFLKSEDKDLMHQSSGTYRQVGIHACRFFRWLYFPSVPPKDRLKQPQPEVIQNITRITRKKITIYKPSDMWSQEDDLLFLKYCRNPRYSSKTT